MGYNSLDTNLDIATMNRRRMTEASSDEEGVRKICLHLPNAEWNTSGSERLGGVEVTIDVTSRDVELRALCPAESRMLADLELHHTLGDTWIDSCITTIP